ncbi:MULTISPECIES: Spy/CpxP family protein refolding chaperone [Novosphingobium]|uniref:Spy/CpxP family protein refolding chaperone n=1 Tax=Novosphingobium mangrovi (ex Huang et al. 2023) TaxID=2976432 RepID=A0ABT2I7Y9_9SPHN|nr:MULTISPECIES: Spy/CpxP family protein refolding chaperone [Novosphingobium]MCT2400929.1 Spy/CpxP family protein refolding chaperone [Novosphingobium mangrovi (ex Huang et al. 2023)]
MNGFGRVSIGAMALAMLAASPAVVQAQDTHSGHHPTDAPAATPQPSTQPPAQPDTMKGMAGMGGKEMPMKGEMMDGMPMCRMMGEGMNMTAHFEQRLGAIRSELNITSAQSQAWDAYASALRGVAANMENMRASMMAGHQGNATMSPIARLDRHEHMLEAMRDNIRTLRPALERLYAGLSTEQKQKADTLLSPQGMMQQMPMGESMQQMPMSEKMRR